MTELINTQLELINNSVIICLLHILDVNFKILDIKTELKGKIIKSTLEEFKILSQ